MESSAWHFEQAIEFFGRTCVCGQARAIKNHQVSPAAFPRREGATMVAKPKDMKSRTFLLGCLLTIAGVAGVCISTLTAYYATTQISCNPLACMTTHNGALVRSLGFVSSIVSLSLLIMGLLFLYRAGRVRLIPWWARQASGLNRKA
jgi:hypothetical protein